MLLDLAFSVMPLRESDQVIDQAKDEWRTGRFDIVPGDADEFIPL